MADSQEIDPLVALLVQSLKSQMALHPLNAAVMKGNVDVVKSLVNAGESVNMADSNGYTPLHYADIAKNTEMAETLVSLGADITLKDKMGMDPFFNAVMGGRYDMVRCFARLGADVNTYDFAVTPILRAVNLNMIGMVKLLAELGADVNAKERGGLACFPLHYAICGNNTEMVELLVQHGADMEQQNSVGMNALCTAASDGKSEIVECLARLGADLNAKNDAGMTPICYAVNRGFSDVVKILLKYGVKLNRNDLSLALLARSISNHDETLLEILLDGGTDPDLERPIGRSDTTALYFSATLGNKSATHLLLNSGADVNFTNSKGMTPMHGSCMYGHTDVARFLLLAGADTNKPDANGLTPLDHLPFQNVVDYGAEKRWRTAGKLVETVEMDTLPDVVCPPLEKLHTIPGLGNVLAIPKNLAARVFKDVKEVIMKFPKSAGKLFAEAKIKQVGSSAEATRTGLPNEMDFIFQVDMGLDNKAVKDVGFGCASFVYPADSGQAYAFVNGSKSFHDIFGDLFHDFNSTSAGSRITFMEGTREVLKLMDRKACTPMMLCWADESGKERVGVSVDTVPCIHINDWPENGTRRTFLMDYDELKAWGYNLVPKPPHITSDIAHLFSPQELQEIWRISFSHLETEHLYRIHPRVKAVYVTAKCLRNPDICQILIRDKGSQLKTAESYVTSYMLKMMFFKRAEEFLNTKQSLGEMVCKVFDDVVDGLTNNFVPLLFTPSVNALDGLRIDRSKCGVVARIMSRFVKALYFRDLEELSDKEVPDDVCCSVYQRDRSLFKIYDIGHIGASSQDVKIKDSVSSAQDAKDNVQTTTSADGATQKVDSEDGDVGMEMVLSYMVEELNKVKEQGMSSAEQGYIGENVGRYLAEFGKLVKKQMKDLHSASRRDEGNAEPQ